MESTIELYGQGFSEEEFADIKKCLETLLSVREGNQPLDRGFGINLDEIVDYPVAVAKNMLSLEIIEKVERYEPRVKVEGIEFEENTDGRLCPHVYFGRNNG